VRDNRYLRNIQSIVIQDYTNFHIVVIDDGSVDNTGALIKKYLEPQQKKIPVKYEVIINIEHKQAMPNLRSAASNYCG
jgi:glycosyltransferase involved in cell wall biosynthesis